MYVCVTCCPRYLLVLYKFLNRLHLPEMLTKDFTKLLKELTLNDMEDYSRFFDLKLLSFSRHNLPGLVWFGYI